ncbi:hypothetical protein SAMN06297422_11089 [Lachnospiraceae bacterium]|nr:hypothetical protein SAMN06297422_11089 [Lachnospiraceae bacterium]
MGGTYVEFFSDEALENVMCLLQYKPDTIVYLGYKVTMVTRKMKSLINFSKIVSPETRLEFIEVQRDNLDSCIDSLNKVYDKYPDAFYELTGGGEMLLIAFGFISATKNLKTLRIDPYTGLEVNMLPGLKPSQHKDKIKISVKENIILHGGLLTRQTGSYSTWSFTTEFKEDIRTIWDIARRLEHKWNRYCSVIEDVVKANPCDETGYYVLPKSSLGEAGTLLGKLNGKGMLRDFSQDNKRIRFRFKNNSIRHIVTKTGNILELHVYEVASRAPEIFTDRIIGAMIDWNGDKSESEKATFASDYEKYMHASYDTINEIDVVLMRSTAPIFISCKSGKASSNSLHELETVTRRFGGKYASKALAMALPLESSSSGNSFFRERAKEMHIWVIDNIYHMTDEELLNKLINLQP